MKKIELVISKKQTTKQLFEEYYGKPYDEITQEEIGKSEEIDWGCDVGGEIF